MQPPFRLFGAELSAFSQKVRSFLRYKGLEHTWIERTVGTNAAFAQVARLPLTPVLVEADGRALQDSTLILEKIEAAHPQPPSLPDSAALVFAAQVLEDYADEWVNKIVFHARWGKDEDLEESAAQAVRAIYPDGDAPEGAVATLGARMAAKRPVIGATADNAAALEASAVNLLDVLEAQLGQHAFLLGGAPSVGDFALAAQLSQLTMTRSGGDLMRARAPRVLAWVQTMAAPTAVGGFLTFEQARGFLERLLGTECAGAHLAWMAANAAALASGERSLSIWVHGHPYGQGTQKYAGKAFQELRRKRALKIEDGDLAALLGACGLDEILKPVVLAETSRRDGSAAPEPDLQDEGDAPAEGPEAEADETSAA
jgi:glutathione S-transferase